MQDKKFFVCSEEEEINSGRIDRKNVTWFTIYWRVESEYWLSTSYKNNEIKVLL